MLKAFKIYMWKVANPCPKSVLSALDNFETHKMNKLSP